MPSISQPEVPIVNACDVLATLRETQVHLAAWVAHMDAYAERGQAGEAKAAERCAEIVKASLTEAACDTRAIARDEVRRALDDEMYQGTVD
jgi:hypothetical protein